MSNGILNFVPQRPLAERVESISKAFYVVVEEFISEHKSDDEKHDLMLELIFLAVKKCCQCKEDENATAITSCNDTECSLYWIGPRFMGETIELSDEQQTPK